MQTTTQPQSDSFQVFSNQIIYNEDFRVTEYGGWSAYLDECGRLIPFRTGDRDVEIEDGALLCDYRSADQREDDYDAGHATVFADYDKSLQEDAAFKGIFHTFEEVVNAPPLRFAIERFLQEQGITFFAGLPGNGKTLLMLNIAQALLRGEKLWDQFDVTAPAERVIYLIPEAGLIELKDRLAKFGLLPFLQNRKLLVHTLTCAESLSLTDPRLLKAAQGADVFLDTAIRFMSGDENSAGDSRDFADTLFNLRKAGAQTIVGAHHSPKAFGNNESITLESAFRGSGDIGGMLSAGWAVKLTDAEMTELYVKNVKARDFEPCQPFQLTGRPHINVIGSFVMTAQPGLVHAPQSKTRRAALLTNADLPAVAAMKREGKGLREIGEHFGVSKDAVSRLLRVSRPATV